MSLGERLVGVGLTEDVAATALVAVGFIYILSAAIISRRLNTLKTLGKFDGETPSFLSTWQWRNWEGLFWIFGGGPKRSGDGAVRIASSIARICVLLVLLLACLTFYVSFSAQPTLIGPK